MLAQQSSGDGLSGPSLGIAQSDILTIDRDLLFRQSLYGKRILADLETERLRLASEARKVDAALAAEEKSLTEQRETLTPEAFRALADAFDDKPCVKAAPFRNRNSQTDLNKSAWLILKKSARSLVKLSVNVGAW